MSHTLLRVILAIWSVLVVSIIVTSALGAWQNGDVLVYGTQLETDNRLIEVQLFDTRSHLTTPILQRLDLMAMQVSPDGRSLLLEQWQRLGRELQIMTLPTGDVRVLTAGDIDIGRWSPDGQWITYRQHRSDDTGIFMIPASGGEAQRIADLYGVYAVSLDRQRVYYSAWGTNDYPGLMAQSVISGDKHALLSAPQFFISDIAAHGDWLAFLGNYAPYIMYLPLGNSRQLGDAMGAGASLSWSPDGERLLAVAISPGRASTVQVMNHEGAHLATYDLPVRLLLSRVGWAVLH